MIGHTGIIVETLGTLGRLFALLIHEEQPTSSARRKTLVRWPRRGERGGSAIDDTVCPDLRYIHTHWRVAQMTPATYAKAFRKNLQGGRLEDRVHRHAPRLASTLAVTLPLMLALTALWPLSAHAAEPVDAPRTSAPQSMDECIKTKNLALELALVNYVAIELGEDTKTRAWSESTDWVRRYQCGDAPALATLQARAQVPETAISGAGMLLLAGDADKRVLIDALARSPYSTAEKTIGLRAVAQMLSNDVKAAHVEMSHQETDDNGRQESLAQAVLEPQRLRLHAALGWALASSDSDLVRAAQDLIATLGDGLAQHDRGERLMMCADQNKTRVWSCLDSSERRSGNLQEISALWPSANAAQRQALVDWANGDADMEEFLLAQITQVDSDTQYAILKVIDNSRGTAARLRAAQAVLNQALTDPRRRPPRVELKYLPIPSTGELGDLGSGRNLLRSGPARGVRRTRHLSLRA